jgi:hypothetical protein
MALANTTLAAACTSTDKQITVASATSIQPGLWATCDGEVMQVAKSYTVGSTTVQVLRAQDGTAQIAHPSGAQIQFYREASDMANPGASLDVFTPLAGRGRYVSSITASQEFAPQPGCQDELVLLNGTSVIALTLVSPLQSHTGKVVTFAGNGIAAHTITYTTVGFGNVGATADLVTFGTTQMNTFQMIAVGGFWLILGGFGTATINVTGPTVA